jgi:tetratricopeptide (TPR) repeat protein
VRANLIDDAARALAQAQRLSPRCLEYQALSADLARDASPAQSELGDGPAAARAAPEEQWIALRRAVREAERHADWGRAVERHTELARHPLTVQLPENLRFELRLSRALCLLRAGLPNVAAYELGSCQEKTPDSFWPVLLAGQASLLTGEMKSAGERFSEAHSLAEKSRDAEFVAEWVVAAFLAEEREDEALAWSARIADPLRRKLALAEIELGRKEPQKALVEAREAVALAKAGDRVEALLLVGNILVAMADGESSASAADAVYEEARAAAPGDPRPILGLAACALAARNDLEGSKKLYLEALGVSPRSSAAHYGLGTVYRRLNDPAAALAAYESCLREAPDHALAHNNRGLLLEAQHRREEARDEFERAAVLAPRFAVARFNLGMSFHRDGQYVRAAEEYERARKLGLDNSLVLGNLGVCLYYAKRYEEATACFSRAIEADPKDFEAYFNRGVVNEVGRNDLPAARPDYEISVRLRGDWTKSRNGLAAAYALEGRVADAALEYRACFRIDPRFVWAYNDLARLLLRGGLNVPSGDALAARCARSRPRSISATCRPKLSRSSRRTGSGCGRRSCRVHPSTRASRRGPTSSARMRSGSSSRRARRVRPNGFSPSSTTLLGCPARERSAPGNGRGRGRCCPTSTAASVPRSDCGIPSSSTTWRKSRKHGSGSA